MSTLQTLAERVLRERTFELMVAPAIADLQFEHDTAPPLRRAGNRLAVLRALLWGVYDDATRNWDVLTFGLLVGIPASYYTLLILVVLPPDGQLFSALAGRLAAAAVIVVTSLGPAIACYWPERRPPRSALDE